MRIFWFIALFFGAMAFSQTRAVSIDFKPVMSGQSISVLKFYVSDLTFFSAGKTVYKVPDSYFLIDCNNAESLHRDIQIPQTCAYDQIGFTLGVDEKTNDRGIGDDDLDPVLGMYWAWQSGYINLKLEGHYRGQDYELHLGGFQKPYLACQSVFLAASQDDIVIFVDPSRFLDAVPDGITQVMSPGEKAVLLSKLAVKMFYR
jgi:hypothetical protein